MAIKAGLSWKHIFKPTALKSSKRFSMKSCPQGLTSSPVRFLMICSNMLALYPNMLSSPQLNDVRHLNKVAVMQLRREPLRPLTFELGQNSGVMLQTET